MWVLRSNQRALDFDTCLCDILGNLYDFDGSPSAAACPLGDALLRILYIRVTVGYV